MRLENRTAIITGGARGIGFAIGQAMAKEGASIVVLDPGGAKDGRPDDKSPAEEAAALEALLREPEDPLRAVAR